jgi:hypothetical protein
MELRAVADARSSTVRTCFERLFPENGLPEAMRSDKGPPFAHTASVLGLSKLSAWWVALGIDLERGRPGCPQDNGGHERLHLDIQRELRGSHGSEQQAGFDEWRRTFNHERPHEALGMRCPAELYEKSPRRYQGSLEDLSYEMPETRRVNKVGEISWRHQQVFISTALAGWSVGLQPAKPDLWEVWFGRLLLGHLDERGTAFLRIDTPGAK